VLLAILVVGSATRVEASPFTSVVVYGDSLSDNGNLYSAIGFPPSPPYFQGRASNGPVAVELLAATLGVPLIDFAWFGATTGVGNVVDAGTPTTPGGLGLPGMQVQFAVSAAALGPFLSDGLFVVWGGPNDLLGASPADAPALIGQAVGNLLGLVASLQGLGAQHIFVPGMPDIGLTPLLQVDPATAALASAATDAFNMALQLGLPPGAIFYDTAALIRDIVNSPGTFGLTNVTAPCFDGVIVCADPDQYLFWDSVHPTAAAHAIFAREFGTTVVPETSTFVLLASGLAACLVARKRTCRRQTSCGWPEKQS
jgi:phospholipase/lecithinase/hemolysin